MSRFDLQISSLLDSPSSVAFAQATLTSLIASMHYDPQLVKPTSQYLAQSDDILESVHRLHVDAYNAMSDPLYFSNAPKWEDQIIYFDTRPKIDDDFSSFGLAREAVREEIKERQAMLQSWTDLSTATSKRLISPMRDTQMNLKAQLGPQSCDAALSWVIGLSASISMDIAGVESKAALAKRRFQADTNQEPNHKQKKSSNRMMQKISAQSEKSRNALDGAVTALAGTDYAGATRIEDFIKIHDVEKRRYQPPASALSVEEKAKGQEAERIVKQDEHEGGQSTDLPPGPATQSGVTGRLWDGEYGLTNQGHEMDLDSDVEREQHRHHDSDEEGKESDLDGSSHESPEMLERRYSGVSEPGPFQSHNSIQRRDSVS